MDAYEATRIVFSRIQSLDPEHASKIMGLLLIQDHGEKEMIRLAFGPESLVHSVIVKARAELGLSPNASSPPLTPPSPFVSGVSPLSRQNSSSRSPSAAGINFPAPWESSLLPEFQGSEDLSRGPDLGVTDEFRFQDQLPFLPGCGSPAAGRCRAREMLSAASFPPYGGNAGSWRGSGLVHRRSCSVNDVCFSGADDLTAGLELKPCLYYSRGYCKNGTTCRFLHGGLPDSAAGLAASDFPAKLELMEQYPELLRSKYTHRAAAGAVMGEEMPKFGRPRLEYNPAMVNSSSRQIYLTFPADSTFREEDVTNYFSIYGPVQDVRIPYQQKRMFGFVTFVYAETVRMILAKGNPHFVCDARVLVKPYKEKGKVPDKYRKQQQIERLEFSACGSPTSLDSRSPRDFQLGGRMMYNSSQEMLWRRKMEEADLQQAIELQNRRLMGLQLLDTKTPYPHHHQHPNINPFSNNQSCDSPKLAQENCSSPVVLRELPNPAKVSAEKESSGKDEDNTDFLVESLEHNLPDNLFASPKKSAAEYASPFSNSSTATTEAENAALPTSSLAPNDPIAPSLLLASSSLSMASLKSCYFPVPRISPGPETIGV